jgi:hypothetical protein
VYAIGVAKKTRLMSLPDIRVAVTQYLIVDCHLLLKEMLLDFETSANFWILVKPDTRNESTKHT